MLPRCICFLIFILTVGLLGKCEGQINEVDCSKLRLGQYICPHPDVIETYIDPKTQQPRGCTQQNRAEGKIQTR